jgi:hypothetical protein
MYSRPFTQSLEEVHMWPFALLVGALLYGAAAFAPGPVYLAAGLVLVAGAAAIGLRRLAHADAGSHPRHIRNR